MITFCKAVLSGATPQQIRDQTSDLAPARLRYLAVRLAEHPDLRVSVSTYDDGSQEVEMLYTGPPHRTEDTIDRWKFSRRGPAASARRGGSISVAAFLNVRCRSQRTAEILAAGA
jgi:hypothetical protein